ncbi:MAG: hypothetical protein HXX08_08440 [Chloroflexi bacterium]|uniref:Glycoside hydrolase family 44 protein n=1 Tax=Candidatus Chlorohelix allophototropha TaxID=3003348 RepID=A0A8T7LZX2_9CHLR|nr:hypothetical protein [Chloroflexota bacterium]WJW67754.1 glycoside hydrolase family 44 protein [Chloroflexota bacterium L227-S17]
MKRKTLRKNIARPKYLLPLAVCSIILSSMLLGACTDNSVPSLPPGTRGPIIFESTPTETASTTAAATTTVNRGITIDIDQTKVLHQISPYIYGIAGTDQSTEYLQQLRPTLFRWGGNPSTRYNWVLGNAWNTGRDGGFHNTSYNNPADPNTVRNVLEESLQVTKDLNAPMLVTIPTIGWVAKNSDPQFFSWQVPDLGAVPDKPGSQAIIGYDPTANRQRTSVISKATKGAPFVFQPNPDSPVIYQDELIARLVKKFGRADQGGVKFYAMDNEPELWSTTHTDVHPTRVGYDEILNQFLEYSSAVKAVDPTAQIAGPTTSGWTYYFNSELDRGNDNFRTAADRKAHNDMAFLPWFLSKVREYDEKVGYRTLDILDIHYYPQASGVFAGDTGTNANDLRLNAVRSLYDPNYVDESWIAQRIRLIPLMYEWINQYYPGTKLAINEWNFGADHTLNGGLAIANALGIFGRYNLYMASYWQSPESNGAGFQAFKMYTNFDGNGTRFGDQALDAKSSSPLYIASYAALNNTTGHMQIMLINNKPGRNVTVTVQLAKAIAEQDADVYELSANTNDRLVKQTPLKITGDNFPVSVPGYSAILIDLKP